MVPRTQHYKGTENLSVMSEMGRYNQWIYDTIAPYLGVSILEAGCGNGNLTRFIVNSPNLTRYIGVDLSESFCRRLAEDVRVPPACHATFHAVDLEDPALEELAFPPLSTIVCSNVLEHLANDVDVLQRFHRMLQTRGRLILQVPAIQQLYGSIDVADQHYRRYSRRGLVQKVQAAEFSIVRVFYFNLLGIPAWIWHGKIRKVKTHPVGDMRAWDKYVPVLRAAESLLPPPLGLSLFAVAEKAAPSPQR
jgi:SAM-dependent methyltransferase